MGINLHLRQLFQRLPEKVKIGSRYVGNGQPTFVIAEIGNNFNGDFELAKELVLKAKEAGADAVKFQRRTLDQVFTKAALEAPYNTPTSLGATYGEHRAKLELTRDQFIDLRALAKKLDLVFFATPFDHESVKALEEIGVDAYKIASFDVTNIPLLEHVAKKNKPIILSTGMSSQEEVDEAIDAILHHNDRLVVLHCVSIYPTPDDKMDLSFIPVMRRRYHPLPVGYSGHETDFLPTLAAVSMGATVVERHFTLDKEMKGPDHKLSLTPTEMADMVTAIRRMETMLGEGVKEVDADEYKARDKHSKSLVTAVRIPAGTVITADMVTIKSPGNGLKPSLIHKLIGKTAKMDIEGDTVIPKEAMEW